MEVCAPVFSRSRRAAAFTSALCLVGTVLVPSGASGLEVTSGDLGGFELDGNQDAASLQDWINAGSSLVKIVDDTGDSGFDTGSKEAQPSDWDCAPKSSPP